MEIATCSRHELKHGAGAAVREDAARGNAEMDRDDPVLGLEEEDVEREVHAEGMDAGAAWDQQAGTCLLHIEKGESQQPRAKAARDRDLAAEHRRRG